MENRIETGITDDIIMGSKVIRIGNKEYIVRRARYIETADRQKCLGIINICKGDEIIFQPAHGSYTEGELYAIARDLLHVRCMIEEGRL